MGDTDRKRSQNERNEILENQLSRGSFNPRREEPEGLYPDLAIQTAMGVTMVLRMIDAQNEPKQPAQPQINPMAALFGAMMQQAAQNQQEEGSEIESDDDE